MKQSETLYKRDATGHVIQWYGSIIRETDANGVSYLKLGYYYGRVGTHGNSSYSDKIVAKSKKTNIEQAEFELNSAFERRKKKGYKTASDLGINRELFLNDVPALWKEIDKQLPKYNTDANNCIKPMKCQKFVIGKMQYPCIIQPKINGVRAVILLEEFIPKDLFCNEGFEIDGKHYHAVIKTKEGLVYKIWHIEQIFNHLYESFPQYRQIAFDGEIYIRSEKVTSIGGAARNPKNILHPKLQFVNFDLSIPDLSNKDRDNLRLAIWQNYRAKFARTSHDIMVGKIWESLGISDHKMWDNFSIVVLNGWRCWDDNQALSDMQDAINNGFEGAVVRDENAEYAFGSRPSTMMKLKKFDDAEFECIGVEHTGNPDDRVGFNVRLVLKNDINDLVFSCTLTGTVNERLDILNNPPIGKSVTVKFYERTKNGLPFHANVVGIRDYEK